MGATGDSLEASLQDAGQGLLELQVDVTTIEARERVAISASGADPAALLVSFLNAIIAEQDIRKVFFRVVRVDRVWCDDEWRWSATATLMGEPIDLSRHVIANEVKAATYSGLHADVAPDRVELRCVLDV